MGGAYRCAHRTVRVQQVQQKAGTIALTVTLEHRILRCASSCTGYKNASLRCKVGVSSWQPHRPPKQQLVNYVNVNKDSWDAKVRYGMNIGYIFALPAIDTPAVYYSRLLFRTHYNGHLSAWMQLSFRLQLDFDFQVDRNGRRTQTVDCC